MIDWLMILLKSSFWKMSILVKKLMNEKELSAVVLNSFLATLKPTFHIHII